MNYYYDVLLNFQDKYYMFYEWDEFDTPEFFKKIPLFYVSNKNYLDFLTCIIKVDEKFLVSIKDKTKLTNDKTLEYAAIITDGKNSLALEFNKEGLVISKSSLTLDDELSINEFTYNLAESDISYEIKKHVKIDGFLRKDIKVKKVISCEIENILKNKNYSKLKYLYLEWFNELSSDYDKMASDMFTKLNNNLTEKEYDIYKIIKMSYNKV